ncbi:hypothetical protein Pcinc_020735, partial [Petrolisthes cinctipes]
TISKPASLRLLPYSLIYSCDHQGDVKQIPGHVFPLFLPPPSWSRDTGTQARQHRS